MSDLQMSACRSRLQCTGDSTDGDFRGKRAHVIHLSFIPLRLAILKLLGRQRIHATPVNPRRTRIRHLIGARKMESDEMMSENLPAVIDDDGFGDVNQSNRLVQGVILRCVDGVWSAKDGTEFPPKAQLIALSTAEALQRWENGQPAETVMKVRGEPLPDLDELNANVPKKKWEKGLDGNARPPWVHQYIAYLLDPRDASVFTFVNGTMGARIAVERLKDKVRMMRMLRGNKLVPVVELGAKPMKTQFGTKQRPDFVIIDWRDLGGSRTESMSAVEHIGQPVKPLSTAEVLNDQIPI
jgi:hypothetical protein